MNNFDIMMTMIAAIIASVVFISFKIKEFEDRIKKLESKYEKDEEK